MQNDAFGRTIGKCSSCGKDVILRDRRDKKTQYCSRACASQARFKTRYRGTGSIEPTGGVEISPGSERQVNITDIFTGQVDDELTDEQITITYTDMVTGTQRTVNDSLSGWVEAE